MNSTVAWRRSPVRRTCVSVMMPAACTRGSLISWRVMISPRISRISDERRSTRWFMRSLHLEAEVVLGEGVVERLQLALGVRHLGLAAHETDHLVERRLHEATLVADDGHTDDRALPDVVLLHFGHRHVELL